MYWGKTIEDWMKTWLIYIKILMLNKVGLYTQQEQKQNTHTHTRKIKII